VKSPVRITLASVYGYADAGSAAASTPIIARERVLVGDAGWVNHGGFALGCFQASAVVAAGIVVL